MGRENIKRWHDNISATFASGSSASSEVGIGDASTATFKLPSGFKSLKMFFSVAKDAGGSYARCRGQDGVLVSTVITATAAGRQDWLPVPSQVMAGRYMKFSASSAQTSAGKVIGVTVKG